MKRLWRLYEKYVSTLLEILVLIPREEAVDGLKVSTLLEILEKSMKVMKTRVAEFDVSTLLEILDNLHDCRLRVGNSVCEFQPFLRF